MQTAILNNWPTIKTVIGALKETDGPPAEGHQLGPVGLPPCRRRGSTVAYCEGLLEDAIRMMLHANDPALTKLADVLAAVHQCWRR